MLRELVQLLERHNTLTITTTTTINKSNKTKMNVCAEKRN